MLGYTKHLTNSAFPGYEETLEAVARFGAKRKDL